MTNTINQSGLIINLFIQHTSKVGVNLINICPVLDVLLQMMEHISNLNICTSVKRAFQRTDTCGNGRVSICSGRRSDTDSKSRVITTTVFCLKNQKQVKSTCIQFGIVFFQHIQEVFSDREFLLRMSDMQRTSESSMTQHIISISNNGREF